LPPKSATSESMRGSDAVSAIVWSLFPRREHDQPAMFHATFGLAARNCYNHLIIHCLSLHPGLADKIPLAWMEHQYQT
jgi:hypothetical protein